MDNNRTKLCIVIPMKNPVDSKQRLQKILESDKRQSLALLLFQRTLAFLQRHFVDIDVLVVTPSPKIAQLAKSYRANSLLETSNLGLNNALQEAANWCIKQGYSSQLILPADIVKLNQDEIAQLIASVSPEQTASAANSAQVTICPASDGGTNALLTTPPDAIPFCYGLNSSDSHASAARLRGIEVKRLWLKHLAFDLDTPKDFQQACQSANLQQLLDRQVFTNTETISDSFIPRDLQRAIS